MKPMGWGILGAGKFARGQMAPAIHAARGARLVAIGTASAERGGEILAYAPDAEIFHDYESVLRSDEVEAVYIPLPNHLHVPWALKALKAGKHVLCEKPIAMRANEIDALIAMRDQTGLVAAEAYMIAHHPQWVRVRELLAGGAIGTLRHVAGQFSYNNPDRGNIRFDAAKGGGSLPDIGVYTIGSVRLATGQEPVDITSADIDYEAGVDITARVSARFEGFSAQWFTSMGVDLHQQVTFLGTKGRIELSAPFNPGSYAEARLVLVRSGFETLIERWPSVNQYVAQVEAFVRSARQSDPFVWSLEDARGTQAVIDRIFEKARSNENETRSRANGRST